MQSLRILWFFPSPLAAVADALRLHPDVAIQADRNPSSDAQFEALATGQVDAVLTAMDNVMDWNLRVGPRDFRIVAQFERTTPLTVVGRKGLEKLSDLRGGSIVVDAPENGFVVALRSMLAEQGLNQDAYALDPVGGVKERYEAIVRGHGDATLLGPPFDGMAIQQGLPRLATVQNFYPAFPGQGLVVSAKALPGIQPALLAWLNGLERARRLMLEEPASVVSILEQAGYPAGAADTLLKATPSTLHPDRAGVELLIGQRAAVGLRGGDTTYGRLVDTSLLVFT